MNPKIILTTIVGLMLITLSEARAQADTSKLSAAHLAAAEQLISTTGLTNSRFYLMRNQLIKSLSETIHIPEKNREKFNTSMSAFMDKYLPVDAFKKDFVKLYAQAFTETELNQLVDFYNSQLGKKVISKFPELMQNGMSLQQNILKDHYSEIESIISESLKE